MSAIRHAGLIARRLEGRWRGALIEGPSGAGKSDLAWRGLQSGWRLVADDRTLVFRSAGRLFGRAPEPLRGRIEARGVDVLRLTALPLAEIVLLALCDRGSGPRLFEGECADIEGITVPLVRLAPLAASAPVTLRLAIEQVGAQPQREYQAGRSRSGGAFPAR